MESALKDRILSGIGRNGIDFSVNRNDALTGRIADAISAEKWRDMSKKVITPAAGGRTAPEYIRSMNEHTDAVTRMRANKDVTVLMPPHTRLAFVKKTMKKLNMATTRFQQDFNTASLDAASVLAEYALDADRRLKLTEEKLEQQNKIIERLMLEQEKLRKAVDELKREK